MVLFPVEVFFAMDLGLVVPRVHRELEEMPGLLGTGLRDDPDGLARGHEPIHTGGTDSDALLSPALLEHVELGTVEEASEDLRNLLPNDPGPVVLDHDPEALVPFGMDLDPDLGKDAGLFTGVQRVVHSLLDGSEQRLGGVVEPE